MRLILSFLNNFVSYFSSVLVKVLTQIENMADRKIKMKCKSKNLEKKTVTKGDTNPRNAERSNNENVNADRFPTTSEGATASVVTPIPQVSTVLDTTFKELSLDRDARIPTGEVLSNENGYSNASNSTVGKTNSSTSNDPYSNSTEAAVELGSTLIDETTHSQIANNPPGSGLYRVPNIQSYNQANSASVDGMACGTSADIKSNIQGLYGPGTVADSESYDPNYFGVSSNPGTSFLPGALRIPPEKPRQDENVIAMNYLKFHNIRLEKQPNTENIEENMFDIEFNSNCGDNYAFNLKRLDASLIRDVVSGALGGGMVSDFTGSEQTLLLDICKRNEIQMYDLFGHMIFGIIPQSENSKLSYFINCVMKKWRKLLTVNFAYMRPMVRINERFLSEYADDIRDKLLADVKKENVYLVSRCYPPHIDKRMFVATGILRRAVEFLCTQYRELMTNITTNTLTSTHVEYCKRDRN